MRWMSAAATAAATAAAATAPDDDAAPPADVASAGAGTDTAAAPARSPAPPAAAPAAPAAKGDLPEAAAATATADVKTEESAGTTTAADNDDSGKQHGEGTSAIPGGDLSSDATALQQLQLLHRRLEAGAISHERDETLAVVFLVLSFVRFSDDSDRERTITCQDRLGTNTNGERPDQRRLVSASQNSDTGASPSSCWCCCCSCC